MTTLTGAEEVFVDNGIGLFPRFLSADLARLVIQPVSEVGGISRGFTVEDVVDIPFPGKGTKDFAVATVLSLTANRVGSCVGTFEDLNSSQLS